MPGRRQGGVERGEVEVRRGWWEAEQEGFSHRARRSSGQSQRSVPRIGGGFL